MDGTAAAVSLLSVWHVRMARGKEGEPKLRKMRVSHRCKRFRAITVTGTRTVHDNFGTSGDVRYVEANITAILVGATSLLAMTASFHLPTTLCPDSSRSEPKVANLL
jgi:hypothetical protein